RRGLWAVGGRYRCWWEREPGAWPEAITESATACTRLARVTGRRYRRGSPGLRNGMHNLKDSSGNADTSHLGFHPMCITFGIMR
ncbi:MAG TPA: hypothetical protein VEG30_16905, partial [Terriglobales bacterium]|nr:hypothetical protein [Terriglobales bacterium]